MSGKLPSDSQNSYFSQVLIKKDNSLKSINDSISTALDAADLQAATTSLRYSHDNVFTSIRVKLREEQ